LFQARLNDLGSGPGGIHNRQMGIFEKISREQAHFILVAPFVRRRGTKPEHAFDWNERQDV
jgi:hypothetical protein